MATLKKEYCCSYFNLILNEWLKKIVMQSFSISTKVFKEKVCLVNNMFLDNETLQTGNYSNKNDFMLIFCITFHQDATILKNLEGLFGRGLNKIMRQDRTGILSHIIENEQQNVEQIINPKASIE